MRGIFTLKTSAAIGSLALALMGAGYPGAVLAQEAADNTEDGAATEKSAEIVVTGTLVRGIAPPGTNVIGVSQAQIDSIAPTSTVEILQNIPQMGDFGNLTGQPQPVGTSQTTNRPSLRGGLPGFNSSGGSSTLVMLNGHRIVGMGIESTTPDPDVIPAGALRTVEVVTDGGSAIYGSDAVAGVLNFITRKDFDGLETRANYGLGDKYHSFNASVTGGRKWDDGSLYISYNYAEHGSITGRERDYIKQPLVASGYASPSPATVANLDCARGNVVVGNQIYALPFGSAGAVAGTANQCDNSDYGLLTPTERRHSVMFGLNQQLTDSIEFELQAFYTNRKTEFFGGGGSPQSASVNSQNAFFAEHQIGAETSQLVYFQVPETQKGYGQEINLDAYGTVGTVTADLDGNWQLRVLGSYSESLTRTQSWGINSAALTNALNVSDPSIAFNPYDPASTNPATLAAITNYGTFGRTAQAMTDLRAVIDGDLFRLPGGAVKLAAGVEYTHENYDPQRGDTAIGAENSGYSGVTIGGNLVAAPIAFLPKYHLSRTVRAAFGELVVPIFGADNATTALQELTISAAARLDDYSDVGSTFNPKFGITWRPVDWVRIRGSWGKSFNAPSLADTAQAKPITASYVGPLAFVSFLAPPDGLVANGTYPAPDPMQTVLVIQGNDPNIKPQKATTYSFGADIEPPFVPGLKLSATYWNIDFKGVISIPPIVVPSLMFGSYSRLLTINPTQAQEAAAIALTQTGTAAGNRCYLASNCVYSILNFFKTNLGDFRMGGLDFSADYVKPTSFGSISLGASGTYELNRQSRAGAEDPWINEFKQGGETPRFRILGYVGATVGSLTGKVTYRHRDGYSLPEPVGVENQTKVAGFDLVDFYLRYDMKGDGLSRDLSFTLNVDNVFDKSPPAYYGAASLGGLQGFVNGLTMGRVFQFGVEKKF